LTTIPKMKPNFFKIFYFKFLKISNGTDRLSASQQNRTRPAFQ
jgi:hypothetical protein